MSDQNCWMPRHNFKPKLKAEYSRIPLNARIDAWKWGVDSTANTVINESTRTNRLLRWSIANSGPQQAIMQAQPRHKYELQRFTNGNEFVRQHGSEYTHQPLIDTQDNKFVWPFLAYQSEYFVKWSCHLTEPTHLEPESAELIWITPTHVVFANSARTNHSTSHGGDKTHRRMKNRNKPKNCCRKRRRRWIFLQTVPHSDKGTKCLATQEKIHNQIDRQHHTCRNIYQVFVLQSLSLCWKGRKIMKTNIVPK